MEEKIRVLILLNSLGVGGAETFVLSLFDELDRERFEWKVCGLFPPSRGNSSNLFQAKGIPVMDCGISTTNKMPRVLRLIKNYFQIFRSLRQINQDFKPNIIHAHLAIPCIISNLVFGKSKVKLVNSYHNTIFPEKIKNYIRKITVLYAKPLCTSCGKDSEKACLGKNFFKKQQSVVIASAVNTNKFDPNKTDKPSFSSPFLGSEKACLKIVQVGSYVIQKGHINTIKAARILKDNGVKFHVVAAGRGELKVELIATAKEYGVEDCFSFLSFEPNEIRCLLSEADIFVMPSLWEGLSVAMLEAMSMAVTVICSRVGGANEVINDKENGFLIPVNAPNALAECIEALYEDPALRRKVADNARRTILRSYSLEKRARQIENIYVDLVKDSLNC